MSETSHQHLTPDQMAVRVAREFTDGAVVNLGVGLPVLCADHLPPGREVLLHSEQGVLGYGQRTQDAARADPYLINARRQCVEALSGMAFLDHAESFGLVRSGRIDIGVLGALEVSQDGDLANCWLPGRKTGLVGGAQDFAERAKRVIVMMPMFTKAGGAKLVSRCTMVLTARRAVDMIVTDVAVWTVDGGVFTLREHLPSWPPAELCARVEADTTVAPDCAVLTVDV